ncbi:MAG: hypothetical protein IJH50_12195 [Kiritimatiellae bacterium]|nr:hypothetical protein [Kiritimatiellia bacterium]
MSASLFQNMAPNAKRSFAVTLVLGATAAGLYLFAVQPAEESLAKAHREHNDLESRLQIVNTNLRNAPANKDRLQTLDASLKPFRDAMLEPLLGSYAMRAKSILEPLAFDAGLSNLDYAEMTPLALPAPRPVPAQLHARRPIRVTAQGSYMGAISFLLRVEKEHPLVTLQSLSVAAAAKPDRQQIEMVFEWPSKGGMSK